MRPQEQRQQCHHTRPLAVSGHGAFVPPPPPGGLKIQVKNKAGQLEEVPWHTFMSDPLNLNGTYHALDCYSTPMECITDYEGSKARDCSAAAAGRCSTTLTRRGSYQLLIVLQACRAGGRWRTCQSSISASKRTQQWTTAGRWASGCLC